MRHSRAVLGGLAVALVLSSMACGGREEAITRREKEVVVRVNCTAAVVNVDVIPWTAYLEGDELNWRLDQSANTDSVVIERKNGQEWPFEGAAGAPGYKGTKNQPAKSAKLKADVRKDFEYPYTIRAFCPPAATGGPAVQVVIDPIMIIPS